jgi:hypothetical protein
MFLHEPKYKKGDKVMVRMLFKDMFVPATITKVSSILRICFDYEILFSNGAKSIKVDEGILIPFDAKLLKSSIIVCKDVLSDLQTMHNILMIEEEIYG